MLGFLVAISGAYAEPPSETEEAISAAAEKYLEAFAARDLDGCLATFAPGKKTVMMGTGPGERWVGLKDIRMAHEEMFKAFEKESFERQWHVVSQRGKIAWTASESLITDVVAGKEHKFTLHSSAVWVLRDDKWQIALLHYSNLTGPQADSSAP
jgi:uncharacterized protein (TIGR02246 family)